ncbi:hypothetical protein D3C81_11370 [compost metagenome]
MKKYNKKDIILVTIIGILALGLQIEFVYHKSVINIRDNQIIELKKDNNEKKKQIEDKDIQIEEYSKEVKELQDLVNTLGDNVGKLETSLNQLEKGK